MNFTLKQLRYVEAAGRLGSIAQAAIELNISQSSITAAIDALEQSLEYDIFVRTPAKGIQSTPSGAETLQLIRGFIDQSRHFEAEVQSVGGVQTGLVRIACYATAAPSFLPPILKTITERFPGLSIRLLEGNMVAIMDYLRNGAADVVFTYDVSIDDKMEFQPLFPAPPYALLPADSPQAKQPDVSFAELAEMPMVMLDLPMTRDYFTAMFEEAGAVPRIEHTTRSAEIARALVSAGFGYTILNILPADYDLDRSGYRALRIRDSATAPVFGIATIAQTRMPSMVKTFIETCLELGEHGAFEAIQARPTGTVPT